MFKKLIFLTFSVFFLILFSNSISYASSDFDDYKWLKLKEYHTGRDIYSVAYNGQTYVAVGQKGLVLESEDGVYWNHDYVEYEEDFNKVQWDGQNFVASTVSGRVFTLQDYFWTLSEDKTDITSIAAINSDCKDFAFSCKLYGFAKGDKAAVAVGESGNMYYGVEKTKRRFRKYDFSYQGNLYQIGNSAIMHINSPQLYSDNIKKSIPAPFIKTINKQKEIFIPAEATIKALAGECKFDENTGLLKIDLNNKSITLDSKQKDSIIVKNNVLYFPLNKLSLLGKNVKINEELIIINNTSDKMEFAQNNEILEAIEIIYKKPDYQYQSLSESIINGLLYIGKQKADDPEAAIEYYDTANSIETNSDIYSNLAGAYRQMQQTDDALKSAHNSLEYNCDNYHTYIELMYIFCDMGWYSKASESINKAISLSPKGMDFKAHLMYLEGKKTKIIVPIKEVSVSNYKELLSAIGSNRKIKVLPGNYNPQKYGIEQLNIQGVDNLIITGLPVKGKDYIDINMGAVWTFEKCYNISLSGININDQLSLSNSSDILINNCKIKTKETLGLLLRNTAYLTCTNSYIESESEDGILQINSSEDITFDNCTMKGYTLKIGSSYDEFIGNINIKNSSLINDAGICSTWSNYVPIKDESGYEVFLGTECWNEWRFLAAIKYVYSNDFSLTYENTYDGNDEIFADGKFLKLADKLKTLMDGKAFPSIDYIVGEDQDYNAYYDFYGKPKLKKLNINLSVDKLSDANLENMCKMIRQLKPIQQDILAYSGPISVIYRMGYQEIAVADFSNSSFTRFLKSDDNDSLEKYCSVMLTGYSERSAADFYNIKTIKKEEEVTKDIANLFMTQTLKITPNEYYGWNEDYGQNNTIEFTAKNKEGVFYITTVNSFMSQGDFMHYYTDMIIKTNAVTGEQYIVTKNNTYKLQNSNNSQLKEKYTKPIFAQLAGDKAINKKITGVPCKDILAFIDNTDKKELQFIFLTALDNKEDELSPYANYDFEYYLGTFNIESNKITSIKAIDLVDFDKMLFN